MAKYNDGTYHKGSLCGGINIDFKLIMCEDKFVIPPKFQSYVFYWYYTHLLKPGMNRTEAMIFQYLYWPSIRYSVRQEVTNCDTCQCTKQSNKKYSKLLAKLAEEIPWNKLYVDLIGPYVIKTKIKKEKLYLKDATITDLIIQWFEMLQYHDKRSITIVNLVETM